MDKTKLLDKLGADKEDRLLLAKVLDRAEQSHSRNIPASTDFLSPQQRVMAQELLHLAGIPETAYAALGGYEGAERTILLFLPDWLEAEDAQSQSPLRFLRASFRKEYHLTHRDFLGSLMGMGIVREKVGDILVGEDEADLIVLDSVASFLLESWISAGRAKLTVSEIPGPVPGGAGHRQLAAAGRGGVYRLPAGPGQGGSADRKRQGPGELAGVYEAGSPAGGG